MSKDAWWRAEYVVERRTARGHVEPARYYPDHFEWPECPVSALGAPRDPLTLYPVETVVMLTEAYTVGGRGAVWALCRTDARLYDAALVIEQCRLSERAARMERLYRD